ncbi:kinesin light chain [Dendryphion nanum]|uniref:Kinesin light chain n=1 Tax=Dendryphion nanum TaxID=256645 RepID=A0A9P9IWW4_9PLEO|nr:kinesin light chain [Dendryphion nanum]
MPTPHGNDLPMRRRLRHDEYTVGWICALPIEFAAAQEMLDEKHDDLERDSHDKNVYSLGSVGGHNVAIACLPAGQIGNNPATAVAMQMVITFKMIQFGLMVGIGGGVPSAEIDVRLGDVVVSQPNQTSGGVIQYDFGKNTPDGFQRTGFLNAPPQILLGAVARVRANELTGRSTLSKHMSLSPAFQRDTAGPDVLFESAYDHKGGGHTCDQCDVSRQKFQLPRENNEPVVHYGTIASGNQVIKDGSMRDELSRKLNGVLCFEMEAAGLMNSFPCLVIRGICDYADSHKNKRWQPYAAGAAAAYAKEILLAIPPVHVVKERKLKRTPFSIVPFREDPDFVGRPDISAWVCEKCSAPASRAALVGLGGVGKSQLAIQYCHDVRAASPQTWVFWVHASTTARFEEAYKDIADRLELPGRNDPKVNTLKLVRDWLCDETNGIWAMVLDNVDDVEVFYPNQKRKRGEDVPAPLATYLPQSRHGSILVTSRSKDAAARMVGSIKHIKEVNVMDDGQAMQLLQNKLKDASDEEGMTALIRALDHVPLAITQAAAYINRGSLRTSISSFLDHFWKNDKKRTNLLNKDAGDLRRDEGASNSVVTTWQMSFDQIREKRPSAADLLSLMSFFNPQGIPVSVLRSYSNMSTARLDRDIHDIHDDDDNDDDYDDDDDDDEDDEFEEDLATLQAYSLVTTTMHSNVSEMHHLVQFCTKLWLSSLNEAQRWRRAFFTLMAREFPGGDFEDWGKCQLLLPHLEHLLESKPSDEMCVESWAEIATNAALYMYQTGKHEMAEDLARRAMQARERNAGHDSVAVLDSAHVLAITLGVQGKLKTAEEMYRRVLEGYERAFGAGDKVTLAIINNLATVLETQGKNKEAENMYRRALEGREMLLGTQHQDTLISMSLVARLLTKRGAYEEAAKMYKQVLKGTEKELGKEHPTTLTAVNDLAWLFDVQKKYGLALELYQRASSGLERVLGSQHPKTKTCSRNLSELMQELGLDS